MTESGAKEIETNNGKGAVIMAQSSPTTLKHDTEAQYFKMLHSQNNHLLTKPAKEVASV